MFMLVSLEDTVRIPPEDFWREAEAIHYQINAKFTNKVIDHVGLCLELKDILEISQGTVYQGDGAAFAIVKFRMIVFKPMLGEILVGKIKSSSKDGLQVSFDFFDQVWIPSFAMPDPSVYDKSDNLWAWEFQQGDDKHMLWMNPGDEIRLRVSSVAFNPPESKRKKMDQLLNSSKPQSGILKENATDANEGNQSNLSVLDFDVPVSPMVIIGTVSESGLGLTKWWSAPAANEEQAEAAGEATEDNMAVEDMENQNVEMDEAEDEEGGLVNGEPEADDAGNDVEDGN